MSGSFYGKTVPVPSRGEVIEYPFVFIGILISAEPAHDSISPETEERADLYRDFAEPQAAHDHVGLCSYHLLTLEA